jgi:hypothetical protein
LQRTGAIALAEFLPETQTLRRLDLSDNPKIDIAGVMALSVSVRMNRSLQYLDVNVMVSLLCSAYCKGTFHAYVCANLCHHLHFVPLA